MNARQRKNLGRLAEYLAAPGPKPARFDMAHYADTAHIDSTECGTVGCAVGHAPFAGIRKWPTESWHSYVERALGCSPFEGFDFDWCFASWWALVDNTPEGAALRIRYLLEHGGPPAWYYGVALWRDGSIRSGPTYWAWRNEQQAATFEEE